MAKPERFPWGRVMQLGIGTLGLPPEQFWKCTLREITGALGPVEMPLHRQSLHEMMNEWPDLGPLPAHASPSGFAGLSSPASGRGEESSLLPLAGEGGALAPEEGPF